MNRRGIRRGPGRPPAAESKDRVDVIVRVARRRFAAEGFDAATLSAIAADAEISLAALYHYVDTKFELYELVFRETVKRTWDEILGRFERLERGDTLTGQLEALIAAVDSNVDDGHDFLAAAPIELLRHPELAHLFSERDAARDRAFHAIIEPLIDNQTFAGVLGINDAAVAVRLLFSGWAMESFFYPDQRESFTNGLLKLAAVVDRAGTSAGRTRKQSRRSQPYDLHRPRRPGRGGTQT